METKARVSAGETGCLLNCVSWTGKKILNWTKRSCWVSRGFWGESVPGVGSGRQSNGDWLSLTGFLSKCLGLETEDFGYSSLSVFECVDFFAILMCMSDIVCVCVCCCQHVVGCVTFWKACCSTNPCVHVRLRFCHSYWVEKYVRISHPA